MTERPYLLMQRRLHDCPPDPIWPDGLHLDHFSDGTAREAHVLLELAYASGGGQVPDFETWWAALSQDSEYAPGLCFPVRDGDARLVAFAQCWTSGFVKDFAVHPHWQRRGIGRSLLLHIFRTFQTRGAPAVSLKVEAGNRRALIFYEKIGMTPAV